MTEVIQAGTAVISMQEYDELRSIRAGIEARVAAGLEKAEQDAYKRAKEDEQRTIHDALSLLESDKLSSEKMVGAWWIRINGHYFLSVDERNHQIIHRLRTKLYPKPAPTQKKKESWFKRMWK